MEGRKVSEVGFVRLIIRQVFMSFMNCVVFRLINVPDSLFKNGYRTIFWCITVFKVLGQTFESMEGGIR